MNERINIMNISAPDIYGLIGYPLGHSFSGNYFNAKFENEGINARYVNFELSDISDIQEVILNPNLKGLNVTIPYKEKVIPYLDSLDDTAAAIGAVNVIKVKRNNMGEIDSLRGYNSDVIGFVDSIRPLINDRYKKALVLGTGGASKAVFHGLYSLGIPATYVSRTKGKGRLTYDDLTQEVMADHLVIVNATPLGMYPDVDVCPDIPYHLLTSAHLCYDVVYNPDVTLFMKRCAESGAVTKNGMEMLLMQASAAWNIWQE